MTAAATRDSGYTFSEVYTLYNEQLHYARSCYSTEQLDKWQADWNQYFARHGMEIPAYAHKIEQKAKPTIEGVVRAPSLFSMTLGWLPSMMATQLLVVPRSMPITLDMCF